jgi:glycosyltransferase involved in cell wall biosynthesis
MKNILYHHRTQGRGGEGVHIREIVTAFQEMGHQVTVISPPGVDPMSNGNPVTKANGTNGVNGSNGANGHKITLKAVNGSNGIAVKAANGVTRANGFKRANGINRGNGVKKQLTKASEASVQANAEPPPKGIKSSIRRFLKWCSKQAPQPVFELMEVGYNAYAFAKLQGALRAKKYDAIYERYAFFCFAGAFLARWFKVPLILEVNEISGIERNRAQTFTKLTSWLEKRVLKRASAIMVVSSFLREELIKRGAAPEKIKIIPNAVNPDSFQPDMDCNAVRQKYDLNGKFCIGFLGHFAQWDRLDLLIDAAKKLRDEYRNVHLLLVGDGKVRPELEEKVRAEGLEDVVTFTGMVPHDQIPEYIQAFDLCVLPHSNPFGSPLVMFEFMAMAKACMVPDVGPVLDVIVHDENGHVFKNGDVDQIVEGVKHLIDHPEERERLGATARRTIEENYTWKDNARRVSRLFKPAAA